MIKELLEIQLIVAEGKLEIAKRDRLNMGSAMAPYWSAGYLLDSRIRELSFEIDTIKKAIAHYTTFEAGPYRG